MMRQNRGNILFLILLAVVLFAALAYAVTSSMRGGGKDAGGENVKTGAAAILGFLNQVDTALMRMQLSQNLKPESISFEYVRPTYNGSPMASYGNFNCTNDACRVFKPDGGGATPVIFDKYAVIAPSGWVNGWPAPGAFDLYTFQWPYAGTDANDVALRILAVKPDVCAEINKALDISPAPSVGSVGAAAGNPANWDGAAYTCIGSYCTQMVDKTTFATPLSGSGNGQHCTIYHLLFAR